MKHHKPVLACTVLALSSFGGCKGEGDDVWTSRLNQANAKLVECRNDVTELKSRNGELKQQLAQAMAAPARVQLTDPDILNLIADLRNKRVAGEQEEVVLGKGDLNPKEASKVVRQGAQALQKCYERALKKNTSLQMHGGLGVMLEITVKSSGQVKEMKLSPEVDGEMTECMRSTVTRWKFPPFAGDSVVVAQRLTLTPKS